MKIVKALFWISILVSLSACSPRLGGAGKYASSWPSYKDQIPEGEKVDGSGWAVMYTSLADGKHRVRRFYPEKKQCTHWITARDKNFLIKEGEYKEWWDDGFKKIEGQFENNERVGLWKNYSFDTGKLTQESEYKDDRIVGKQKNYSKHGLSVTYTYVEGIKEGPFVMYDSTGLVTNEGQYKADTIFEQTSSRKLYSSVEVMPKFSGCTFTGDETVDNACAQKRMLEYIYTNIKYPRDAREFGFEGTAIIRYTIDKNGKITDAVAVRGLCRSIENECLSLVKSMPNWDPGTQDGKPVKVQFNLPIRFKLQ